MSQQIIDQFLQEACVINKDQKCPSPAAWLAFQVWFAPSTDRLDLVEHANQYSLRQKISNQVESLTITKKEFMAQIDSQFGNKENKIVWCQPYGHADPIEGAAHNAVLKNVKRCRGWRGFGLQEQYYFIHDQLAQLSDIRSVKRRSQAKDGSLSLEAQSHNGDFDVLASFDLSDVLACDENCQAQTYTDQQVSLQKQQVKKRKRPLKFNMSKEQSVDAKILLGSAMQNDHKFLFGASQEEELNKLNVRLQELLQPPTSQRQWEQWERQCLVQAVRCYLITAQIQPNPIVDQTTANMLSSCFQNWDWLSVKVPGRSKQECQEEWKRMIYNDN